MRIISGQLKKQQFKTLPGRRTHPMGDRIKVALFNTIQDSLPGARVLDAFAGSGALGFEALSRGADYVQLIEKDRRAYAVIKQNLESLKLADSKKIHATQANCASWSDRNIDLDFDVIFADPPFDDLNLSTIEKLSRHLTAEGLMVLSHSGREAVPTVNGVVVVDNRMYGEAALSYYRKAD
jgi:16S rRNA (guanine966-N2)-methyltransferase